MFSRSMFQEKDSFKKFTETIKNTKNIIEQKIGPYKNMPIIILTGMIGVGKSSISCCLLKKKLTIDAKGKIKFLVGEGVGLGINACTTIPSITFDSNNHLMIADLPGFEDNRNDEQEILNSIAINDVFNVFPNQNKNYKIIFVITSYDFLTNRCSIFINSLWRLKKMFTGYDNIKNTFGIIITKGSNEWKINDYIEYFNSQYEQTTCPNQEMREAYQFLNSHKNNIFLFPEPLSENIGKQYEFKDYERLLAFIKTNYCTNPEHRIVISEIAKSNLLLSYEKYKKDFSLTIDEICKKIKNKYRFVKGTSNIRIWIKFIEKFMENNIESPKDFENIIRENIPGNAIYDLDFSKFSEIILFDELITKLLPSNIDQSYLKKIIFSWCDEAGKELISLLAKEIENENLRKQEEEKKRRDEELRNLEEKLRRQKEEEENQEKKNGEELASSQMRIAQLRHEISPGG